MTLFTLTSLAFVAVGVCAGPIAIQSMRTENERRVLGAASIFLGLFSAALLLLGASTTFAADAATAEDRSTSNLDTLEQEINRQLRRSSDRDEVHLELSDDDNPAAHVKFPADRPTWVEGEDNLDGDVHTIAVASDLHFRQADCERPLLHATRNAVAQYVNSHLHEDRASLLISFDDDFVNHRLVSTDGRYDEVIEVSVGKMYQSHRLLEFDNTFRREIDRRWQDVVATGRLLTLGLGSFGVLGLMGIAFGYLRLDTATKGYYTGRLQFLAAVA
ncbi:MAG: hypothetical protein QF805_23160, partial [Pirellulaceae bacterium]|nr:hypothetical protein [Pirellulaceae bacterium]